MMSVIVPLLKGSLAADAALNHGRFLHALSNEALQCAAAGDDAAAFAWGLAAYLGHRRFAHAWLPALALAFAAGKLRQIKPVDPDTLPAAHIPSGIPRRIMQYWDSEPVPHDVWALINGWLKLNDEYPHQLFTDVSARVFIQDHFGPEIRTYYDLLPFVASKSDLFRLCWLLHVGGIYVDADEELLGKVRSLFPNNAGLVLTWTNASTPCVNNNFVVSRPHHPVIAKAFDLAMSHIIGTRGKKLKLSAWLLTGPGAYSMAVMDMLCSPDPAVSDLSDVVFHAERDYLKVVCCPGGLEYKNDPTKNWRLNEFDW